MNRDIGSNPILSRMPQALAKDVQGGRSLLAAVFDGGPREASTPKHKGAGGLPSGEPSSPQGRASGPPLDGALVSSRAPLSGPPLFSWGVGGPLGGPPPAPLGRASGPPLDGGSPLGTLQPLWGGPLALPTEPKMKRYKSFTNLILIKLGSYEPINNKQVINLAKELKLPIHWIGNIQKATRKGAITVLSGPHVHKKSREQYKIDYYQSTWWLGKAPHNKLFLFFKNQIYEKSLDKGLEITLTFYKLEKLRLL